MTRERQSVWDAMDSAAPAPLTDAGAARRDSARRALSHALAARRARRTAVRAATACALLAAVAVAAWVSRARPGPAPDTGSIVRHEAPAPADSPAPERPAPRVQFVSSDAGVLARCAPGPAGPGAVVIDDAELVRLMSQMGRPVGIVRTSGRTIVTADVEPGPPDDSRGTGPPAGPPARG